ncbi:MAG: Hsp20/alpha crystallin family protein [Paracoccaceae bacterium]
MAKKDTSVDVRREAKAAPEPSVPESRMPLSSLRSEIDRLFEEFDPFSWRFPAPRALRAGKWQFSPAMDLVERNGGFEIEAELPGMDLKDIDIKLGDGTITIKGEKSESREEKEESYHLSERRFGAFQRTFRVPDGVDTDKIDASYANGVLHVKLPKSAEAKKKEKKIAVKAA